MYLKLGILTGALFALLAGCAKPIEDAAGFNDPQKALLLMTVEEGYVFKAGKAFVALEGTAGSATFMSLAAPSGGPGTADRKRDGGIYSYRSQLVDPGVYAMTRWKFAYRRGSASILEGAKKVTVEPGKIYYLGRFFANNLTQTSRLTDQIAEDLPEFEKKFPFLIGREVLNYSDRLAHECWAQNVTPVIVKDNPTLKQAVAACYNG